MPASAKVVEFFALARVGRGDGGNPGTPTANANGIPACNRGLVSHLNASIPARGLVEVSDGPAPQSLMILQPLEHGTAGPTGPSPTLSMPGIVGKNGGASFMASTCRVALEPSFLPSRYNALTRSTSFRWPANHPLITTLATTPVTHERLTVGFGDAALTVAPGAGPGNFTLDVSTLQSQRLEVVAGANQVGGGLRVSGEAHVRLNLNLAPGVTATGTWVSGPLPFGHSGSPVARVATDVATFTTNLISAMVQVNLELWGLPLTTGTVRAEDHGGDFTTIRTRRGRDNRTPNGEFGSLLLVSPWTASLRGLGASDLYFSGTSEVRFFFLPEPRASAAFASAIVLVLALHRRARRAP